MLGFTTKIKMDTTRNMSSIVPVSSFKQITSDLEPISRTNNSTNTQTLQSNTPKQSDTKKITMDQNLTHAHNPNLSHNNQQPNQDPNLLSEHQQQQQQQHQDHFLQHQQQLQQHQNQLNHQKQEEKEKPPLKPQFTSFTPKEQEEWSEDVLKREVLANPGGMSIMISVQQIFGVSFLGSNFSNSILGWLCRLVLIALNLGAFYLALFNYCLSNQAESSTAFLRKSTSPALTYIRASSLAIYFLLSYSLNIYMNFASFKLFRLIKSELLGCVDPVMEKYIGRKVVLIQLATVCCLNLMFTSLLYLQFGEIVWTRSLENIFNLYASTTPIAWLYYVNTVLANIAKQSANLKNMNLYVETLLKIGQLNDQTTFMFAPAICILIFNAMIVCIASSCMLVVDFQQTYFISITGFVDYSVLMFLLVVSAVTCFESVQNTSARFEFEMYKTACHIKNTSVRFSSASSSNSSASSHEKNIPEEGSYVGGGFHRKHEDFDDISSQLMMLNNLGTQIQMAPLGLFSLNRSWLISFYSFMLSYSIILIQTSESQVARPSQG